MPWTRWLLLPLLTACAGDDPPTPDFAAWTNPVTGAVVQLPEAWRHSPDTAAKGQTVVGYFLPRFAWTEGRYGHVTLHHEDLTDAPMSLEDYAGRLAAYLQERAESITEVVYTRHGGRRDARFEVETVHARRLQVLRIHVWTWGDGHAWYAVAEAPGAERAFFTEAMPIVDRLVASTEP